MYTFASIWIYRGVSVKLHDSLNLVQSHASQGGELITVKPVKERWKETGEHTQACECRLHYSVWRRPSACLYSFSETAVGILSLPMPMLLLGSLSQPRSSYSNSSSLIGLYPHLLSFTTSSTLSQKRYRCTWSSTALSQHTSLCIWIAYVGSWAPAATLSWSQTLLFPFLSVGIYLSLYPQLCGSLVMMWPISLTSNWVTVLQGWRHCREYLCPQIRQGH